MRYQTSTRMSLSLAATLFGLVATAPVAAQGSAFEQCAKLESDVERLACFDEALTKRKTDAPASEKSEVPSAAPTVRSENMAPEPPTATLPPESSAAPGQTVSESSAGTTTSGRQADNSADETDLPGEYTAVVVAMYKRPLGQMVVTLDNGEVWSEQYASRAFLVDVGDTITMRKSRFTRSYRLVAPGGRGHKMTRLE